MDQPPKPLFFDEKFVKDLDLLKRENNKLGFKVMQLVLDIQKSPFEGIGKPEVLKGDLSGWWSRRITDKHRLIYKVVEDQIFIVGCYGHYGDK